MMVRLLRKARADLDAIGEYIARDNPSRAMAQRVMVHRILRSSQDLTRAFNS